MNTTINKNGFPPLTEAAADKLARLTLGSGSHREVGDGVCAMEAVAYVAGEPHTDHPECACPVITSLVISFNDSLPDNAARDRWIKPLGPLWTLWTLWPLGPLWTLGPLGSLWTLGPLGPLGPLKSTRCRLRSFEKC